MQFELEIIDRDGVVRLVELGTDAVELAEFGLRARRVGEVVRVEPLGPGQQLSVDGETLFCKDLVAGATAEVDGLSLRLLELVETAAPGARTGAERPRGHRDRGAGAAGGAVGARRRSAAVRRRSSALPAIAVTAAVVLVGVFVFRRLEDSTWPQSPAHFVELARHQLDNNRPERALETLAFALREASGETRRQAEKLQTEIRERLLEQSAGVEVSRAQARLQALRSFVSTELDAAGSGPQRAAARELVRLADEWLQEFGEVTSWHSRGKVLREEVERLRSHYLPATEPGRPETADDVLFSAQSRLRFVIRDYVGALARLDGWLAAHPDDARVEAERARMLEEGGQWLDRQLERLGSALDQGRLYNVERDLAQLEQKAAIPAWQERIAALRARVDRQRR